MLLFCYFVGVFFPLTKTSTGREAHFGRQPVRGRRSARLQVAPAARCGSQLLPPGGGGAAAGLGQGSPGPRRELGGVPKQRGGVGR